MVRRITNIVGLCDVGKKVALEKLYADVCYQKNGFDGNTKAEYEPENCPALVYFYKNGTEKYSILFWNSGKAIITGAKTLEQFEKFCNIAEDIMNRYIFQNGAD